MYKWAIQKTRVAKELEGAQGCERERKRPIKNLMNLCKMFNFVRINAVLVAGIDLAKAPHLKLINKQKGINMEEVNNLDSKVLELQQRLKNLELALDLYETDLYKIDKRLETIEKKGE